MTCHAARRDHDVERRLQGGRRQVWQVLIGTDDELAGLECAHLGAFIDDAASETTCRLLATLEERNRRLLAEIDARRISRAALSASVSVWP